MVGVSACTQRSYRHPASYYPGHVPTDVRYASKCPASEGKDRPKKTFTMKEAKAPMRDIAVARRSHLGGSNLRKPRLAAEEHKYVNE